MLKIHNNYYVKQHTISVSFCSRLAGGKRFGRLYCVAIMVAYCYTLAPMISQRAGRILGMCHGRGNKMGNIVKIVYSWFVSTVADITAMIMTAVDKNMYTQNMWLSHNSIWDGRYLKAQLHI